MDEKVPSGKTTKPQAYSLRMTYLAFVSIKHSLFLNKR
jgi:hypothetical protein